MNNVDSFYIETDTNKIFIQNIQRQTIAQEQMATDIRVNSIISRALLVISIISPIVIAVMASN